MPALRFTQFLMPHGRQVPVDTDVSQVAYDKAQLIIAAGYKFEIEMLRTGEISATIADPIEEIDVEISVTDNGPAVQAGIERMIERFTIPTNR